MVDGVVAQLVEHHNGIVGVRGSNPLGSTIPILPKQVIYSNDNNSRHFL